MVEWAYQQRGAVAMVCELWDLFKRVDKEVKPFIDNYVNLDDAFMAKHYDWDKKTMAAPASRPGNASSIRSSARWNWALRRAQGLLESAGQAAAGNGHKQVQFLEQLAAFAPALAVTATATPKNPA